MKGARSCVPGVQGHPVDCQCMECEPTYVVPGVQGHPPDCQCMDCEDLFWNWVDRAMTRRITKPRLDNLSPEEREQKIAEYEERKASRRDYMEAFSPRGRWSAEEVFALVPLRFKLRHRGGRYEVEREGRFINTPSLRGPLPESGAGPFGFRVPDRPRRPRVPRNRKPQPWKPERVTGKRGPPGWGNTGQRVKRHGYWNFPCPPCDTTYANACDNGASEHRAILNRGKCEYVKDNLTIVTRLDALLWDIKDARTALREDALVRDLDVVLQAAKILSPDELAPYVERILGWSAMCLGTLAGTAVGWPVSELATKLAPGREHIEVEEQVPPKGALLK